MNEKQYQLTLTITNDEVRVAVPSGSFWSYKRDELPALLHGLTSACLRADAELCKKIADAIRIVEAK